MVKHSRRRIGDFLLIMLALIAGSPCIAGEITASLDRDTVPAGQGALLTLTVSGRPEGGPELPKVKDFIIESRGQSQEFRNINGVTSRSVTYRYVVGSQVPGVYEIPAITMTVDGDELSTDSLTLKVLAANAAQPPAAAAPGNAAADDAEPVEEAGRFGFLNVELLTGERKHVYVGEIAPVKIEAWIPSDGQAQLRSGIQPEGQAFTLHNVSEKPSQTTKVRDGKRYIVVTWYAGISATKSGKYPVSLSLEATVAVRDDSADRGSRPRMGGAFDDPFFDDLFDQMRTPMIQKDVTLTSRDEEIDIRLLPEKGKPESFSGAVGDFSMKDAKIPAKWNTGEPQSLEASVTGSGNFALLDEPKLVPSKGWKVYPGKSDFTPGDVASFSGTKDFRFSAVPGKGGSAELALELSYFDPDAGEYRTVRSPGQVVGITGEDIVLKDDGPVVATPPPEKDEDQLIGQHDKISELRSSLVPLAERPLFVGLLGGSGVLCLAGIGLMVARARREDPERIAGAELDKATRDAETRAMRAADAGDVGAFFVAARHALRLQLGAIWNRPAEAITSAEVELWLDEGSPVMKFFRESDRQSYGRAGTGEFSKWQAMLDEALLSLNTIPSKS